MSVRMPRMVEQDSRPSGVVGLRGSPTRMRVRMPRMVEQDSRPSGVVGLRGSPTRMTMPGWLRNTQHGLLGRET
jgi:hypothetical protein